jgi:hypothetical protein
MLHRWIAPQIRLILTLMTEHYVSLGGAADWHFYLPMGLAAAIFPFIVKRFISESGRELNPMQWWMVPWGLWMIVGSFLGLPQMMMTGAMPLFLALAMLVPGPKEYSAKMPLLARAASFIVFLAMGWWTCRLEFGRSVIVLGPVQGSFKLHAHSQPRLVSRSGLVTATHFVRGGKPDGSDTWDVMHKDWPYADFQGTEVFWGPHGMIRGDQVGQRIAAWAGVQPKVDTLDVDSLKSL